MTKKVTYSMLICVLCCSVAMLTMCKNAQQQNAKTETPSKKADLVSVSINPSAMIDSSGSFEMTRTADGSTIRSKSGGWFSFEVEVPVAGRYRTSLQYSRNDSGSATLWIEDYIDNTDDRTYDITGKMELKDQGSAAAIAKKDGSPLNKGKHKMKLHFSKGGIEVQEILFTLMKRHRPSPTIMTQMTDGQEWEVVWSDEFDGSGIPDTNKWTFDIGNWGWGNNEVQYYTENRTQNARMEEGNLIIEARKNDMGYPWTSTRLTTRGKVGFIYGKIEFRAMVPKRKGTWSAGWTLGNDYVDEISWPYCGEIDILESVGFETNDETGDGKAHATVHSGAFYFKKGNHFTGVIPVQNISDEFHIYAIEWTPSEIRAFVDGNHYYTYDKTGDELEWPFNKAQNIILNLTMGGGWGGAIDEDVTSQKFVIDYVRVYGKQ